MIPLRLTFANPPLNPALDAGDIALLKTYGVGPYSNQIKQVETDIQTAVKKVNELIGKFDQCYGFQNEKVFIMKKFQ